MSTTPQQNPITGLQRTPFLGVDGQTVSRQWMQWFQGVALQKNVPSFVSDTHSNRSLIPAANYANGTLFFETDRQIVYIAVSGVWFYFTGTVQTVQASLPADLGPDDINLLAEVTDYAHLLIWTGTAWTWGPGELGSDFILLFLTGPNPAIGWKLCDGSANIPKLNFDGTLAFVTVPTIASSFYRQ